MVQKVLFGAIAGLGGGLVFGIMMGMMGMLPMVAQLVGSSSAGVGFIVHMANSAIIGGAFGFGFGSLSTSAGGGIGFGLLYGLIWWFLGPLTLMPLMMGMGLMLSATGMSNALPSLWGHLIYGGITGFVYWAIKGRAE